MANATKKRRLVGITTTDNPFNPLTQFDEWLTFDSQKGYGTCNYLDRIANVSDEMDDDEQSAEIERAIDEIIDYGFAFGPNAEKVYYKKVIEFEKA